MTKKTIILFILIILLFPLSTLVQSDGKYTGDFEFSKSDGRTERR